MDLELLIQFTQKFTIHILFIAGLILFIVFKQPTTIKIVLLLISMMGALSFLFTKLNSPPYYGYFSILFGILCLIELFWDGLDKNFTGTDGTFKLVVCTILSALGISSIIAGSYLGLAFIVLGFILLGLAMFEMFYKKPDKKEKNYKGIVCIVSAIICVLTALSIFKFPNLIIYSSVISLLFFLSFVFSLFEVPGFNSSTYVVFLFLIANMPIVYLVVKQLLTSSEQIDYIYIPLLISFYVCCIAILLMTGSLTLLNDNTIIIITGVIGACLMYFMKTFPASLLKVFFTLVAMILLFIETMYYMFYSDKWYWYLIVYYLVLFISLYPFDYEVLKRFLMPFIPIVSAKNGMFLGAEVAVVLLYLYTRPLLKNVYTIGGKMIVNLPVSLQKQIHVKVDKKYEYNYSLSFWVYINQVNPSSSPQATEFIPFLSYGNKPLFTYNSLQNIMRVQMQTKDKLVIVDDISNLKLQKWNHIVVNQENNIVDVFLNGELHKSTDHVIPSNDSSKIYIGEQHGISGEVCNVMFFEHMLSTEKISKLYNDFSEKNPPTV